MTMTVRDVMTAPVFSVPTSTPLKDVARLLVDHRISGVPVVDDDGGRRGRRVRGRFPAQGGRPRDRPAALVRAPDWARPREASTRHAKIGAITAGEAMTSPAATIEADRSTTAAATLMVDLDVNRLPVLEDGRLIGIVSRADLVRAFVRSDDQLAESIRHDVLLRVLWLNPELFDVEVHNGVASVGGRVERRSTAEMIERAVRSVPGVVDVTSAVTWDIADDHVRPTTTDPVFPYSPR